jgi:hypothetical protein
LQLATMVQATYLIALCWIAAYDITVLSINPLRIPPCELKNKTVLWLPKTNIMLLGSLHISHDHQ